MRGVPVRIEIGPKDVEKDSRYAGPPRYPGREGKTSATFADLPAVMQTLTEAIHTNLY